MWKEFKAFVMRGNVMDLAVGVIIGAAFGAVIKSLVDDVIKTIQPLAEKTGNQLVVNCPADIGDMHTDPTRVRQALLNLASNANKFTERGTVTCCSTS